MNVITHVLLFSGLVLSASAAQVTVGVPANPPGREIGGAPPALSPESPLGHPGAPSLASRIVGSNLPEEKRNSILSALERRDYKTAETVLVSAIGQTPRPAELLSIAAGVFFLDHDFWNTAIALKKADVITPVSAPDRFLLCLSYISLGRGEWARPELGRLIRDSPNDPTYSYWLARIDYDDRRYPDALQLLQKVVRLSPDNSRAYDNLALCLEAVGDIDSAQKAYNEAIRLNRLLPHPSPWPLLNLGTLQTRSGDYAAAERNLQEALRYGPALSQTHFRLGALYDKTGSDDKAIGELKKAASLDPRYSDPLYLLARIYHRQGDDARAQQTLAQFKAIRSRERAIGAK